MSDIELSGQAKLIRRGRPRQLSDEAVLEKLPATAQTLADELNFDRVTVYRRLRWLENEGMVRRDTDRLPHLWEVIHD